MEEDNNKSYYLRAGPCEDGRGQQQEGQSRPRQQRPGGSGWPAAAAARRSLRWPRRRCQPVFCGTCAALLIQCSGEDASEAAPVRPRAAAGPRPPQTPSPEYQQIGPGRLNATGSDYGK